MLVTTHLLGIEMLEQDSQVLLLLCNLLRVRSKLSRVVTSRKESSQWGSLSP